MTVGKHSMTRAAVLCVMVAATGGPLHAQAATPAEMAPVEGEEPVSPPICTDRPTKANVTCTVPAGEVQIESDAVNWTRTVAAESRSDTVLYTNPTVKYGLSSRTDLEANLAPYETIDTAGPAAGPRLGGIGDLTLRLKQRLSADGATTQITLLPFVKVPTARRGIGNGRVEGGVVLPVSLPIPGGFTLTLGPEVDVLADGAGSGYHAGLTSLANLSHGLGTKITVYAEFWNSQGFDPAGTVHQASADIAASYNLTPTVQVDAGGNFGLTGATPATQFYVGVSTRF